MSKPFATTPETEAAFYTMNEIAEQAMGPGADATRQFIANKLALRDLMLDRGSTLSVAQVVALMETTGSGR